ncbi:peptidoglycan-binding protein [Paenibacillus sp. MY03]|jgi:nucleoid-associated protein YgaU|uniref:Peptidoglycan-binding protein n=1 Tax=Paenibacillus agaridevorans TaxID=171404 RepID=A0A2R5EJP9_9BACL|nr:MULTISPECIES: LysM peptidoglycan-binding domain-containing protein [Paenibacillus]OUS78204.1 peptidoglycan-binding protein [Paenibacillus sp. MY03]QNK59818.1 LysM peptidoglycan-binding domain-containing protein [Paenibacillus sp. PAMC21692]GBG06846.1 peptidoglycan-binding protein [Paenibacillus agaridevorans]
MALTKAQFMIYKSNDTETVDVLFNPTEYELTASNNYPDNDVPGLQSPTTQFVGGNASTLSLNLFFDTYELGTDVREHTSKIVSILDVDSDLHAPPECRFVWGSLNFKGVIVSITQRFTMFLESGKPVRATLDVEMRSTQTMKEQYKEIPRQSADRTKRKTVKQGDQLWSIAAEEYEDSGKWRHIAEANGIDNPRLLAAGRNLTIPRLE